MKLSEFLIQVHEAVDDDVLLKDQEVVIEDLLGVEYQVDRIYCVQGTGVGIDIKPREFE